MVVAIVSTEDPMNIVVFGFMIPVIIARFPALTIKNRPMHSSQREICVMLIAYMANGVASTMS